MSEAKSPADIADGRAQKLADKFVDNFGMTNLFELSRMYGRAAAWLKGPSFTLPAEEALWIAGRLDAISKALFRSSQEPDRNTEFQPRKLDARIAQAVGVRRTTRGRPRRQGK